MGKKWVKRRHQIIQTIAGVGIIPVIKSKVKIKHDKMRVSRKEPCIILYNHQTVFDQFLVGMYIKGPVYYVATEDITSMGFISKLLKFAVNVIPFKKSTNDINAVRNCISVIKEGGSIAISPEGNRTYSGETGNMKPSIVKLVKKLKVPVIFFKITGGYGANPRWAEGSRKGLIECRIPKILKYDDYKDMSNEEFFDYVKKELYVNDNDFVGEYKSKRLAERLERCIYVCPKCGISEFESDGNMFKCKHCGLETEYLSNKTFKDNYPFKNVLEWYRYQEDYINKLDLSVFGENEIFSNKAQLINVIPYKRKVKLMKECEVKAFSDHIEIVNCENSDLMRVEYSALNAMSVLGKNKFNFYYEDKIYQVKSDEHFNALKYVNIYYRSVNMNKIKNEEDFDESREFLGL